LPDASEPVVIDSGGVGALTVIVMVVVAVFGEDSVSLTVKVTVEVPAAVGVPLIVSVPPLAFDASPAGSPLAPPQV
jgi:hypothetical protein